MKEFQSYYFNDNAALPSLGSESLADEINWLDCYVDQLERRHERSTEDDAVL